MEVKKVEEQPIPVPSETLQTWRINYTHGDKSKISDSARVDRGQVIQAFKGFAKPSLIEIINTYYGLNKQ